ncbi:hypothetical protein ACL02U_13440 [Streptomyces sp. MS06]|uniref:hypothetical protein n=1 Tax=Streptomyces sp. MS06 TaxID=3385974 RepID=UPI0039A1AB66
MLTHSGSLYAFTDREYNGSLAPGASATSGWVSSGTGTPVNCTPDGAPCDGGAGGSDTTPPGGVTVGSATASSLIVTWTPAADDSASRATRCHATVVRPTPAPAGAVHARR